MSDAPMIDAELTPVVGTPVSIRWATSGAVPLLLAIIIALVTCFYGLTANSLWFDEAFSVELARLDWTSMWDVITRQEANMMLYYVLLHSWLQLGSGEFVARAPSAAFAVATVVPLYAIGRHLLGHRQAAVAVMLVVVNSFFVRYAQELRGYSLVLLLTTTASYLFLVAFARSPRGNVGASTW
jgi:mannosyltransferase